MALTAIFLFAFLKVKDAKYRMLFDIFEFTTHKLCKNKWIIKYKLKIQANFNVQISAQATSTYFHERLQYSSIKICMTFKKYKINNAHFKAFRGFRKQRPDMDMSNNYDLLGETGAHWDMGHNGTMGFPGKPPMGES